MANLNETLHQLRREYVAEADENLDRIDRLISTMQTEPTGPTLEHLYRRFLGLAGSGDTYGFPEVSRLGRQADPAHVRATAAELGDRGIELIRVERGGEVTYHGPGQLVAYPILALDQLGVELQSPFATKSLNHLPLDDITRGIETDLVLLLAQSQTEQPPIVKAAPPDRA